VGWWLAVGVVVLCAHRDFTDVGHIVALGLGMLLSLRFRSAVRWTWFRVVLLTVGALFGYLIVVNGLPPLLPPMAGAFGAAAVLLLVVQSRLRHVRKSLTPLPAEQPALT
jgi:CHASE2 domain-containing sensor protein